MRDGYVEIPLFCTSCDEIFMTQRRNGVLVTHLHSFYAQHTLSYLALLTHPLIPSTLNTPSPYLHTPTGFSATMLGINSSSAGTYNASSGGGSTEEKDENSGMTMGSPSGGSSKKSGKGEKSKKGKKPFVRVKDGEDESGIFVNCGVMCALFYHIYISIYHLITLFCIPFYVLLTYFC